MRYPDTSKLEDRPLLEADSYIVKLDSIMEANKDGEYYRDKNGRQYVILKWAVKDHDGVYVIDMIYPDANPDETSDYGRLLRIREIVSALGVAPEGGELDDWRGKVCRAAVIVDTYKGKDNNKIAHYEPLENAQESFTDNKDDDDLPF